MGGGARFIVIKVFILWSDIAGGEQVLAVYRSDPGRDFTSHDLESETCIILTDVNA
jgi:hypothetical protein